jgi:hypothetical protein
MICQLVVNPQTGKPLDEGTLKKAFSVRNRGGRRRYSGPEKRDRCNVWEAGALRAKIR